MKFIFAVLITIAGGVAPLTLSAQPTGFDSPIFKQAAQAWLDDDDQTALPALAKLARANNHAAQVLLGRIAVRPQGPWLSALSQDQRDALLKAPGRDTAWQSWLHVASRAGSQHARILAEASANRFSFDAMARLARSGEIMIAADFATKHLTRANDTINKGLIGLWREGLFPTYSADIFLSAGLHKYRFSRAEVALLEREAPTIYGVLIARGALAGAQTQADWRDVRLAFLHDYLRAERPNDGTYDMHARLVDLLYSNRDAVVLWPLRVACDAACGAGQAAKSCMVSGNDILRFTRATQFTSPTASLIPETVFASSARALSELRFRVRRWTESPRYDPKLAETLKACTRMALGVPPK